MKIRINFFNSSKRRTKKLSKEEKDFRASIGRLVGYRVNNLDLFRDAFTLRNSSTTGTRTDYERLEFLGDSILGAVVSCYLFRTYTDSREGFLTQMKSKIVNRNNLNYIGKQLGLAQYLRNVDMAKLGENIHGNIFEALVGAIYMDTNYEKCYDIVLKRFITQSYISGLESKIVSHKSLLLEWRNVRNVSIKIETQKDSSSFSNLFLSCVWLEGKIISKAYEYSKKKAEEKAAQRAFYSLKKKEDFQKWLKSKK